jgi:general stress protein 26
MSPDPIIDREHVAGVLWRWLEQAADNPSHPIRLMTLATRDSVGHPDARLMVLRGADRDSARLWMHTNPNTHKLRHIREHQQVCLVAYDPASGVQLRLYGCATVHTQGRIQKQHVEQTAAWLSNYDAAQTKVDDPENKLDPRSEAFLAQPPDEREITIFASTAIIDIHLDAIDWQQILNQNVSRFTMLGRDDWKPETVDRALINTVCEQSASIERK